MAIILVTNGNDSGAGSLRAALGNAAAGDTIEFAAGVTTVNLTSSLVITKNVTIEGSQPGTSTPGVTVNGGGISSDFSVFTINAGVSASIDGLIIEDGHSTGTTGTASSSFSPGGAGGVAAGGIFDAGALTLTDSVLAGDTATGGTGGSGGTIAGGGAGGNAVGGIYVAATGSLALAASDSFTGDSAVGGTGGDGGFPFGPIANSGGAGGISGVNGGVGASGQTGVGPDGGAGGAPGQPGGAGGQDSNFHDGRVDPGGGGGGGSAFADVAGPGTVTGPVPCYCPGTLIEAARGQKKVETLKIGDKVRTASGALRPIKWIGRRSYAGRFIMGRKDILPVCFKAGSLGDNVPERDLWISPQHAMYFAAANGGGVLIEAKDLINGLSIVQAEHA